MQKVIYGMPMSHISIGLSILLLILILPAIYDPKKFRTAMEEFLANNVNIRISGIFALFIAFLILNTHWTVKLNSTRSIMTVVGYLLLLKGIIRIWFPGWVKTMCRKFLQKDANIYILAAIGLVFALGIGYLGIWVY